MSCRITDLKDIQVLNINDGSVIGYVDDLEFDTENGRIVSMIVHYKSRGFTVFSREEEMIVPWENISVIGEDSILIHYEQLHHPQKSSGRSSPRRYFLGE